MDVVLKDAITIEYSATLPVKNNNMNFLVYLNKTS